MPDEWNHIALTISETEVALYLNDYLEATAEVTTPLNLIVGDATLGTWNLDREWAGMMDEVLIYDRALSEEEIITLASGLVSVPSDKNSNKIPQTFNLSQNYPNPFNLSTTISFYLPERSNIHLNLFNILGKEVKEIAGGIYEAGLHKLKINGSSLSSGVYFYRLEIISTGAGNSNIFIDSKKLIFNK